MRTTLPFLHTLCLLICLLPALKGRTQMFGLSNSAALVALNGIAPPAPSPAAPLGNFVTVAPFTTITVTAPGNVTPNQIPSQIFNPNSVGLTFAYKSALIWWSGYTSYEQAAQSLNFSGGDPVSIIRAAGAASILAGTPFTFFQNYSARQATMIIRANDQTPVIFPITNPVTNPAAGVNTYIPTVSSWSVVVPLSF